MDASGQSMQYWRPLYLLVMTVFEQSLRMGLKCISVSIYLRRVLILIDTKVPSARCPLADVPGSACETSPPVIQRIPPSPPPPSCILADVYRLLPTATTVGPAYDIQQYLPRSVVLC